MPATIVIGLDFSSTMCFMKFSTGFLSLKTFSFGLVSSPLICGINVCVDRLYGSVGASGFAVSFGSNAQQTFF